jgi:hypothetical protein
VDALDEPGQAPTGEVLPSSARQAFVEVYFDHRDWAEEWFARPEVRTALLGSGWARVHGVRLQEECGLDRRGPALADLVAQELGDQGLADQR